MADDAVMILDHAGTPRPMDAQTVAGGDFQQTVTLGDGVTAGRVAKIDTDGSINVETNRCSVAAVSTVTSVTTATTLLAANANRRGAIIFNASTAILYLKYGTAAQTGAVSATSYSVRIAANTSWIIDVPTWEGALQGIWASVNGSAQVTDLSA